MATRNERTVYLAPTTALLPEVPMAGWDHFQEAGALAGHVHTDAFELCLIVSGTVEWWAGDELYEVRGGEIYVTRPGETHGGVDAVMNPCELYWFHVIIQRGKPLPGLTGSESNMIRRRLMNLSLRSFPASDDTRSTFDQLLVEHKRPDQLARTAARAALHAMLVGALRDHDAALNRRTTVSRQVQQAIAFMQVHLTEPFRIESAADAAGISVGRLHARFIEETGQTPGGWRLRQLVARAKQLLRSSNQAVIDIALDLGFSSSQYFATAFKRVTGLTPAAYRRAHQA